jgi:hypothetical protein
MTIETTVVRLGDIAGRPLCSAYDVVHLSLLPVEVEHSCAVQARTICWALGTHRRGSTEVVGSWFTDGSADLGFDSVESSLAQRGLVRIKCLVRSGDKQVDAAPGRSLDGAGTAAAWQEMTCVSKADDRLRDQQVRTVATAVRFGRELSRTLCKRVFQSDQVALEFLGQELEQLERRLCWTAQSRSRRNRTRARPRCRTPTWA